MTLAMVHAVPPTHAPMMQGGHPRRRVVGWLWRQRENLLGVSGACCRCLRALLWTCCSARGRP